MRPISKVSNGDRFARWVVVDDTRVAHGPGGQAKVLCRCDCGTERLVDAYALASGATKSCGCMRSLVGRHHASGKSIYNSWGNMIQRCTNQRHPSYGRYGGRGITVCEEWRDCAAFVAWAEANGYEPGKSIERIDNDKGYSPDNCRWATRREQQRNRYNNRIITFRGETKCLTDWAAKLCTTSATLDYRIRRWGDIERALTEPIKRKAT